MGKNESSKSKAEIYREERKARIAKANKKNAVNIEKRTAVSKALKKIAAIVLAAAIALGIVWKIVSEIGLVEKFSTALTVGGDKVTSAQFNYYFSNQYQQTAYYANYYQQNLGYGIGFDPSKPPDEQKSNEKDENGKPITWARQISNSAVEHAQFVLAYYNMAVKAGYKLDDDEKTQIKESIEEYRKEAAKNNYSLNAFLRQTFGGGFNEKSFTKQLEMENLAQNFYNDKKDETVKNIKDEDIKKEYEKNRKNYDYTDVRYFSLPFVALTAKDGETDDALKLRQKEANDKLSAEAEAILEKISDEQSFIDAVKEYKEAEDKKAKEAEAKKEDKKTEEPKKTEENKKEEAKKEDVDFTVLSKNAQFSSLSAAVSEKGADWAFDAARKAGDDKLITDEKGIYIVYCVRPAYAMNSVDVRHCLIKFDSGETGKEAVTEERKKATYEKARALLTEWEKGPMTEESFAETAKKNTQDEASASTGGLYEKIRITDSYVKAFKDWSFDPARKKGDRDIIETEYGYHIMYFVNDNKEDLDWKNVIRENKGADAFEAYNEKLLAKDGAYPTVENKKQTAKVVKKFCDKLRRNAAYASANQNH